MRPTKWFSWDWIARVKWRICTNSKRTIAAKLSSAPGRGALDMIAGKVVSETKEKGEVL